MRAALTMLVVFASVGFVLLLGTVRAMEKGSPPLQYRLVLSPSRTNGCTVRVTWPRAKEFTMSANGEVVVEVPPLPRACSLVCWGVTLQDGSPYSRKIIEVLSDGRVVRQLSLRQLEQLQSDRRGARRLHL